MTSLSISNVTKQYGGLRPLRIRELSVAATDRVALVGFDQPSAELFVNLVTGQSIPDAGDITVFDRPTADITDSQEWLRFVDRFGIVSLRTVLLEGLTVFQNLAIPFTLSVEPLADDVRARAEVLADEVRLPVDCRTIAVSMLSAALKMRVRLGRALALDPSMLLLEHVSAGLSPADAGALGRDTAAIVEDRRIAAVVLTADETFARAVASRVLRWEPATGRLNERRGWFGGRVG